MKLWQMLSKRGKVTATISIVVVLAGLGIGGYSLYKYEIKADVISAPSIPLTAEQIGSAIDSAVKPQALTASAPAETDVNVVALPPILIIFLNGLDMDSNVLSNKCFSDDWLSTAQPGNLPDSKITGDDNNKCVLSFNRGSDGNSFSFTGSFTQTIAEQPNLPSTYKDSAVSNTGSEEYNNNSKMSATFNGTISYNTGTKKWSHSDIKISSATGTIDGSAKFDFSLTEDLLAKVKSSYSEIDPNSHWKVSSSGKVTMGVAGTFNLNGAISNGVIDFIKILNDSPAYIHLSKLDFCSESDNCLIKIAEDLDLKAKQKNNDSQGDIVSVANHQEIYTGVGGSNLKDQKIFWKSLKIEKTDNRNWGQKLIWSDQTSSNYTGKTNSTETSYPLELNHYITNSNIVKDLTVSSQTKVVGGSAAAPRPVSATLTTTVHTDKIESNKNGTVTRTGNSTYSNCSSFAGCYPTQVGVFDSIGPDVLIISPPNPIQPRVPDPFGKTELSRYVSNSFYDVGSIYVPGFFTASYQNNQHIATISSKPLMLLPKNVYIFNSFDPADDLFGPATVDPIYNWGKALSARGVNVKTLDTSSPDKFLQALSEIDQGSWVVNIGHGLPNGLWAGSQDDAKKNLITYAQILKQMQNKHIRMDTFAAISCYAGRAPLSGNVIGSMGVGLASNYYGLGGVAGIGTNSWNYTTSELLDVLTQIAGGKTCSANNTTGSGSGSTSGGTTGGGGIGDTSGTGPGSGTTSGTSGATGSSSGSGSGSASGSGATSGGTTSTSGSTSGSGVTLNSTGGTTTTSTSGTGSGSTTQQTITTTTGSPIVPITNPNVAPVTTSTQFSQNNYVLTTSSSGQTTVAQLTTTPDTSMMQSFTAPQVYQVKTPSLGSQLVNLVSNNSNTSMALTGQSNPSLLTKIGALFSVPTTKIEVVSTSPPISNTPVYIINGVPMQSTNPATSTIPTTSPTVLQVSQSTKTITPSSVISIITKTSPIPSQAMITNMMMLAVAPR